MKPPRLAVLALLGPARSLFSAAQAPAVPAWSLVSQSGELWKSADFKNENNEQKRIFSTTPRATPFRSTR